MSPGLIGGVIHVHVHCTCNCGYCVSALGSRVIVD